MIYLPIPVKILAKYVLNKVPRSLKQGLYQISLIVDGWSDASTVVSFQVSVYVIKDTFDQNFYKDG